MKDLTNEFLIKAGIKTKNYFEFQAECSDDIIEFHNTITKHSDSLIFIWKFGYSRDCLFSDVECELTVNLSFDEVINIMKLQDDSHVMIKTLNLINQEILTEDSNIKFTTQNLIDQEDD